MKNSSFRVRFLVILIVIISFCAAWLPISLVRAGWLAQDGAISDERPQDPPAGELKVGPFSNFNGRQLAGPDDPVKLMIELEDEPAIKAFAKEQSTIPGLKMRARPQAVASARAQMARINRAQAALVSELSGARIKARVLSRAQSVFNGVAVEVAAGKMGEIRSLPGVKAVHVETMYYRMTDTATQFIGAPRVWDPDLLGGSFTGNGVVVAVIDDGIDYLHTNFSGSGSQSHYAINDPTIIGDVPGFPGPVIVGGYDFAGDNFDAASSDPNKRTPQPDPDPYGCNDHGTKVAGAIAGRGVNANGSTYTGPYNQNTPATPFRIGPGVAPEAALVALRVFGCQGATSSSVIVQAIERAFDPNGDGDFSDRADIINMSLGSPFFPLAGSPELKAIDNAGQAGVITVVAAGNNGDTYYSVNGLGQTRNSISVAAVLDNGVYAQNVQINSPSEIAGKYPAAVSEFGPALGASGLSGNVVYVSPTDGCAPLDNAAQIAGNIALVDRGTCTLVTKTRNAQNAGATAVIVINDTSSLPINVGDDGTGRDIRIPNYLISQTTGDPIRQRLQALNQVNVSLLFGDVNSAPTLANTLLPSSSRGGAFDNVVKPDIAAPGYITSSWLGSGNGAAFGTGTSMASPMMAGVMALLVDKYPNSTSDELKALLYSTGADVFSVPNNGLPKHGTTHAGAGTVQSIDAAATELYIAYKQAGNQTLTFTNIFGDVKAVTGDETVPVIANITNNGNSTQSYTVSYDRTSDIPGVDPTFPSTVNAPGNSSANFQINWNFVPANMKHTRDPAVSATQGGNPRHWLSEELGYFKFTPAGGGRTLRLPVYFAAYPASDMRVTQNSLNLTVPVGTVPLGLAGQHVQTGNNFPTDEISIASPFELQGIDPNDSLTPSTLDYLDLQYTGVRSNFRTAGDINNTRLLFGVSTYGDWNSPNQLTINVFIDNNRDGTADFQLFNTSFPNAQGGPSDVFVTRVRNLQTGNIATQFFVNSFSAAQFNTVPFNTNVIVLPVAASALGLTDTNGVFTYEVKTSLGNVVVDSSGPFTYDATRPGLDFGQNTIIFDLNNTTIPVGYNLNDFRSANSEGALILHHHNTSGNRAQILPANLGREADVAPRPSGNGSNTIADWTQVGRFVAGLDDVNLGNEFQRADCAPRASGGDGRLSISDWVQAGRYSAGLDPATGAGGPYLPIILPQSSIATTAAQRSEASQTRALRALNANFAPGQANNLEIELEAQGGENALGFSLNYDPAVLSFVSAEIGAGAQGATLLTNASQTANGRAGIALALPAGQGFAAGARRVVSVRFNVTAGASAAMTQVSFGDQPIRREIADVNTNELAANYADAVITITRAVANVSAASYSPTDLAVESIAAAFGAPLATRVEVASSQPLPTSMAGTTVRVKDSAGTERLSPLFFISPAQINYQIASGTVPGPGMVTVTSGDGAISMGNVNITSVAPGLFAANADGQGVAAALALRVRADGSQIFEPVAVFDQSSNRFVAAPIDLGPASDQLFLVLFGTGWRFRSSLAAVAVSAGGINSAASFAGGIPGFVGLDQLNLPLSRALAGKGEIEIALTVDGKTANRVRMAIR